MGDLQYIVMKVKCASAKFLHQVMLHLYILPEHVIGCCYAALLNAM